MVKPGHLVGINVAWADRIFTRFTARLSYLQLKRSRLDDYLCLSAYGLACARGHQVDGQARVVLKYSADEP
jgi:hypothetical protein